MSTLNDQAEELLFTEVDPVRFDAFRAMLGMVMLVYFCVLTQGWVLAGEWISIDGFHASSKLLPGILVAPLMHPFAVPLFGLLFLTVLVLWTVGHKVHWTGIVIFICVTYVSCADFLSQTPVNRLLVLALAVMACSPRDRRALWPIRILQGLLLVQYFADGWTKAAHGDWLWNSHALWSQTQIYFMNPRSAFLAQALPQELWSLLQWGILLFELLVPILLCTERLRPLALCLGLALHLGIALLMEDMVWFSLLMVSFYVLFLPSHWLHAANRALHFSEHSSS